MATAGSDNEFPKLLLTNSGDSATPAAGFAKLYVNASKVLHYKDDTGADVAIGATAAATPVAAAYKRTSGDYTTTSATMVDVDGTNLALTITTLARRVQIGFVGTLAHSAAGGQIYLDVSVDGTDQGQTSGPVYGLVATRITTAAYIADGSFIYLTGVLSAGSHTFKLRWATSASTATIQGGSASKAYMQFYVAETMFTA